jgi:hypothetical protein
VAGHRPDAQRQQNRHGYQIAIADQVRRRGLRWFARSGLLIAEDTRDMLAWDNTGFSLDAAVSTPPMTAPGWNGCYASLRYLL